MTSRRRSPSRARRRPSVPPSSVTASSRASSAAESVASRASSERAKARQGRAPVPGRPGPRGLHAGPGPRRFRAAPGERGVARPRRAARSAARKLMCADSRDRINVSRCACNKHDHDDMQQNPEEQTAVLALRYTALRTSWSHTGELEAAHRPRLGVRFSAPAKRGRAGMELNGERPRILCEG